MREGGSQAGFSLMETLVAALLFSLSLSGMLHYYQGLVHAFQFQWQGRQAWQLAQQQLEHMSLSAPPESAEPQLLAAGWQLTYHSHPRLMDCQRISVTVSPPLHPPIQLSRWFCGQNAAPLRPRTGT